VRHRSLLSVVPLCAAIFAVASCGSTSQSAGAEGSAELTAPPALLTLKDVAQPPASPRAVVMRLLFYWQWGSVPNVIALYSPQAVDAVGAPVFSGVVDYGRPYLTSVRPRVSFTERMSATLYIVGVNFLTQNAPPADESFLVQEVDGRWRVDYDSLTDRLLRTYVKQRGYSGIGGVGGSPARASLLLAERYRSASAGIEHSITSHRPGRRSDVAARRARVAGQTSRGAARPHAAVTTTTAASPGG
jgi:hypothetical protein